MDVSDLLAKEPVAPFAAQGAETSKQLHPYPTRQASYSLAQSHSQLQSPHGPFTSPDFHITDRPVEYHHAQTMSLTRQVPKTVNFQLLLSNGPNHRARLPLRVHINLHDTTDSIVTTVKNFYGLYEGQGVSFEDANGFTLIAQYENLKNNDTVYVRVYTEHPEVPEPLPIGSPQRARLDEPFHMTLPPQPYSRPSSRAMKMRDVSPPPSKGHRSGSVRSQNRWKLEGDVSDSDAGSVSVSSSRRDQLASAEISLDNIVEGGRRKKAKFESSELPLFVPSQQPMTASISSISPQRRLNNNPVRSPLPPLNPYTFSLNQPLPSPQTLGEIPPPSFATPRPTHRLRTRGATGHSRLSGGSISGVLPTPDPTIGSVISDEDVAMQLMRLGDASNLSLGRTSTSTVDDALSGKAEVASSVEASEDETGPPRKKARSFENYDRQVESSDDDSISIDAKDKSRTNSGFVKSKPRLPSSINKKKPKLPPSIPPSASRKTSNASSANFQQFAADEEDLSSKPRCQRCRKSKKGCDRQRPCQRCKDAGIGIEGCVSEDEGNGRKGRYGRHMGVPVKKSSDDDGLPTIDSLEPVPFMDATAGSEMDNIKKRKR